MSSAIYRNLSGYTVADAKGKILGECTCNYQEDGKNLVVINDDWEAEVDCIVINIFNQPNMPSDWIRIK